MALTIPEDGATYTIGNTYDNGLAATVDVSVGTDSIYFNLTQDASLWQTELDVVYIFYIFLINIHKIPIFSKNE